MATTTTTSDATFTSDTLTSALQLVESGNHEGALTTLLGAWRATRATPIANTIDALSNELLTHEPPIVAVGKMSEGVNWSETFDARRSASYVRLLENVPFNSQAPHRIVRMQRFGADPRLTSFAREWLTTKPPLTSQNRVPFFATLITMLDHNEDVRIVPTLLNLTMREQRKQTTRRIGLKNWKPLVALASRLAMVEATAKANAVGLPSNDLATLHRIDSILTTAKTKPANVLGTVTTDSKELFARVYANPEDDEARAVLSDLLQQQNDPRGEFIALQLASSSKTKKTSRERELERTWGRVWLGPIAPFLDKGKHGVVFERGFAARCRLAYNTDQLFLHDEWSTITHIDIGSRRDAIELLTSPVARAMRHVTGVAHADLRELYARDAPGRWKTLETRGWRREDMVPLLDGPKRAFREVRRLIVVNVALSSEDVLGIIDKWPVLEDLVVNTNDDDVVAVMASPSIRRLDHLLLKCQGFEIDLLPKTKPSWVHLIVDTLWNQTSAPIIAVVRAILADARCGITHLHVTHKSERARLVGDILGSGGHDQIDVSELRAIAKNASIVLTIMKEKA